MHCSNCSQTLLQRFSDAVITFIRQKKTITLKKLLPWQQLSSIATN